MQPTQQIVHTILCIHIAVLLTGCGLLSRFSEPTPLPPVELTYVTFADDADTNNAETQLITQFEQTYPHITINRSTFSRNPSSYLAETPPPDLMVLIADYNTFSAVDDGLGLDISNVWQEANLVEAYPTGFRTFGEREGRQYFLPVAHTWTTIYYNRAVFEQHGLTPPATWDEFRTIVDTLWLNGVTPLVLNRGDDWSVSMWFEYLALRLHGPDFYEQLVRGEVPYDDFRVQVIFETWRGLIEDGSFGETAGAGGTVSRLIKGEAAMLLTSPVLIQDLPDSAQEALGFFRFPIIDLSLPIGEAAASYGYLIPASTEHPAEATQFLSYMSTSEIQTALTQQLGSILGVVAIHQGIDAANFDATSKQGIELIRNSDSIVRPYIFAVPDAMNQGSQRAFSQFLRSPDQINDVIELLEETRQSAYERD